VAISPDGLRLAFVAGKRSEPPRVWIRPLDRTDAQALAGTEGAAFPFWSPDGQFVAFFAGGKLKKIAVAGGAPQTLCDVDAPRGGTWSPSGVIVFAKSQSPLSQVSSEGGSVTSATTFDAAQEPVFHYWPQFLPDGEHFLYLQRSAKSKFRGIYIGSFATPETIQILATDVRGIFAQGHLLFIRDGLLFAQTFDVRALRLSGEPVRVADHVGFYTASYGYAAFDASASGAVVFGPALLPSSQLTWFDRDGHLVAGGPRGGFESPRLSSDQKTVAVSVRDVQTSTSDIWVFDVTRGVTSRVTVHPSTDWFPAWMPDGAHLLFASTRDATNSSANVVYRKSAKGIEDDEPVNAQSPVLGFPDDVSLDGQFVLAHNLTMRAYDIGAYPLVQNGRERAVLSTPFNEVQARFSPDGKWVAHASDESGRFEVYVRPFPFSAERTLVSTAGGMQPEWRHDGKELFYISADGKMMTVSVLADAATLTAGTPRVLFAVDVVAPNPPYPGHYAVSADGQRFLLNTVIDEPTRQTLTVILNWQAGLQK
jgi:Tol biopolymer transport system component